MSCSVCRLVEACSGNTASMPCSALLVAVHTHQMPSRCIVTGTAEVVSLGRTMRRRHILCMHVSICIMTFRHAICMQQGCAADLRPLAYRSPAHSQTKALPVHAYPAGRGGRLSYSGGRLSGASMRIICVPCACGGGRLMPCVTILN